MNRYEELEKLRKLEEQVTLGDIAISRILYDDGKMTSNFWNRAT